MSLISFFGNSIKTDNITTTSSSQNDFAKHWENQSWKELEDNLTEDCILYDQSQDTVATSNTEVVNHFFKEHSGTIESVKLVPDSDEKHINYGFIKVKTDTFGKKSIKLVITKGKINAVEYLGNL